MKKVLIALVIAASIFVLYRIGAGYYESHMVVMSAPPPPIGIEAGPVKVSVDENTSWMAIAKALVTILSTYLGIKLINKYVKA